MCIFTHCLPLLIVSFDQIVALGVLNLSKCPMMFGKKSAHLFWLSKWFRMGHLDYFSVKYLQDLTAFTSSKIFISTWVIKYSHTFTHRISWSHHINISHQHFRLIQHIFILGIKLVQIIIIIIIGSNIFFIRCSTSMNIKGTFILIIELELGIKLWTFVFQYF